MNLATVKTSIRHTLLACTNTSYGRTVSTVKNDKNLSALHHIAKFPFISPAY